MSIQWRWTRRAINIPWQDRSRGEWREDGEGERGKQTDQVRQKGREEVSERIGSMDRFIRQAVAFFHIIREHFSGPSRDNEDIAPLGDLQPIQGRYKMLPAYTAHSYTHTQPLVANFWLFSSTPYYIHNKTYRRAYILCTLSAQV